MDIRRANDTDITDVLRLLSQVLELHAAIRPDIFKSGTTKYTREELSAIFSDDNTPVYVACDDDGSVKGYAFCVIQNPTFVNTMVPMKILYIDDLCVDKGARGTHIGSALFKHVKSEAKRLGCYEVTLNVWEGNDTARAFYERMGMKIKETQMELVV